MLHIVRSTYSAYENGANEYPFDIVAKLVVIDGTMIDYLVGLTDDKERKDKNKK